MLASFDNADGQEPVGGLIIDAVGDLFGTTFYGAAGDFGTVFELAKTGNGYGPTPTVLASFTTSEDNPYAGLITDAAGDLFGTTENGGGPYGAGSIFEVTDSGYVACYLRGTLIETRRGHVPVETITIGDLLSTRSGAARPVRWVGRRAYAGHVISTNLNVLPICFRVGSLADGVPARDLYVSPLHAMFLDDVLIPAASLVNGVSIVQLRQVESVEYFHLELDTHDVIFAEGAASESFIDDDSRGMFHNAAEFAALYPDQPRLPAFYCAPRVTDGYALEAVRHRLAVRAGLRNPRPDLPLRGFLDQATDGWIKGWAQNPDHTEAPVCLDILLNGKVLGQTLANLWRDDLHHARFGSGRHSFAFSCADKPPFDPEAIEVRRSLDQKPLPRSNAFFSRSLAASLISAPA